MSWTTIYYLQIGASNCTKIKLSYKGYTSMIEQIIREGTRHKVEFMQNNETYETIIYLILL